MTFWPHGEGANEKANDVMVVKILIGWSRGGTFIR